MFYCICVGVLDWNGVGVGGKKERKKDGKKELIMCVGLYAWVNRHS
jgi:hypothetical protein